MIILDGKKVSEKILATLEEKVQKLKEAGKEICLAVVLVGNNPVSLKYIQYKEKACNKIGIKVKKYFFPETISQQELINQINELNFDKNITGIIIQLPLPQKIDTDAVLDSVNAQKDIDGLAKNTKFTPPTAKAILALLDEYKIDLKDKNVCIFGYGRLVGRPLAPLIEARGAKLSICQKSTNNVCQIANDADVLISAAGVPNLIGEDTVKQNAVVIDAGTAESDGVIKGDVDFENVKNKASYITPPIGGVGPVTIAMLLENLFML